jgi:hypothetical protein
MRINVSDKLGLILTKNARLRHMSVAALIGWMTYETLGAAPSCSHPATVIAPQPSFEVDDAEDEWARYADK